MHLTAIALYDAFICCWQDKYTTQYIRPVTVINEKIDHGWLPLAANAAVPGIPKRA